jgi:hypothetical protein
MELLDDDWLAALAACQTPDFTAVGTCTLRVDVSGGPSGTRTWHVVFRDGVVRQAAGGAPETADLTLTMTWPDAVRVAQGELGLNAAFMQGRLKTDGPTGPLLAILTTMSGEPAEACRRDLADQTTF